MNLVNNNQRLYQSILRCIPNLFIYILVSIVLVVSNSSVLFSQTNWTKYANNPVLDVGPSGAWDDELMHHPFILFDGNTYHMWYDGESGNARHIGYASSSDGLNWTKNENNPVLTAGAPGEWDDGRASLPVVLFDGTTYRMWYGGVKSFTRITTGYATSTDAVNWTKYANNPVMEVGPAGSWDSNWATPNTIKYDGATYKMWYSGFNGNVLRIGYATSDDGIDWTKHTSNPILEPGAAGTWDDLWIFTPEVQFYNDNYLMWYSGLSNSTGFRLGLATSPDGIVWTKHTANPVLDVGSSGTWDSDFVGHARVLFDSTEFKMYYVGDRGGTARIGYATSDLATFVADTGAPIPTGYYLSPNYPNPFNPSTIINYELSNAADVVVRIYSILGHEIKTLVNASQTAGAYSVVWNGKNARNESVASGIYIYELKAGSQTQSRKMLLLR